MTNAAGTPRFFGHRTAIDAASPGDTIRTRPQAGCILCGSVGESLYGNLTDCLFGTNGTWGLTKCPDPSCGLIWLNPMPIPEQTIESVKQTMQTVKEEAKWGLGQTR